MKMMLKISENINKLRKENNMTQEQLAEALGVSVAAVSKWERGVTVPELKLIADMADMFCVSMDTLIGYEFRNNNKEAVVQRLKEYVHDREAKEVFTEIEKAIHRYPNCFEIIYYSAVNYKTRGLYLQNISYSQKALSLYHHALHLIYQNTNVEISENTIWNSIADIHITLGEYEKGIDILKKKNPCRLNHPLIGQTLAAHGKDYAFQKLSQKSIAAFSRENTANYISAFLGDAATIEKGYLEMLFDMTAHMVIFVGSLIMMLIYSPAMTVIACFFFVLPIGVSFITGNKVEKAEKKVSEKNGEFIATLKDSLSGFNVMKSFKAETVIASLVKKSNQEAEYAKCEKRKLMVVISGLAGVAGVTAQLGTFLIGACLVLSGKGITPGILIVFLDLTANVIGPIQEFPELFASKKAAVALIHKLAEALEDNVRDEGMEILLLLNQIQIK